MAAGKLADPGFGWGKLFELIFSASGATVIVAVLFFILVMILIFVPSARKLSLKLNLRDGSLEKSAEPVASTAPKEPEAKDPGADAAGRPKLKSDDADIPEPERGDKDGHDEDGQGGEPLDPDMRMWLAARNQDEEGLENAFKDYSEIETEELAHSLRARLRLDMGIEGALDELIQLEKDHVEWVPPSRHLAIYYESIEEFDLALRHLETGLERSQKPIQRSILTSFKAKLLNDQGKTHEALSSLHNFINELPEESNDIKAKTYEHLANIYKKINDNERLTVALEKSLMLDPNNRDIRFRLAYQYGEQEHAELLACHHYRILTVQDPAHAMAYNNYGAALGELGAKVSQIRIWKKGIGEHTDYPYGNLAITLGDAGFLDEASEYLDRLPPDLKAGERARYATDRLEKLKKDEQKKLEEIASSARQFHDAVGEAARKSETQEIRQMSAERLGGEWALLGAKEEATIQLEGNRLELSGEWKTPSKIYRFTGRKTDAAVRITAIQSKSWISGLGLMALAAPLPGGEKGRWVDPFGKPEEIFLYLVVHGEDDLRGIQIKDSKTTSVTLKKN